MPEPGAVIGPDVKGMDTSKEDRQPGSLDGRPPERPRFEEGLFLAEKGRAASDTLKHTAGNGGGGSVAMRPKILDVLVAKFLDEVEGRYDSRSLSRAPARSLP